MKLLLDTRVFITKTYWASHCSYLAYVNREES